MFKIRFQDKSGANIKSNFSSFNSKNAILNDNSANLDLD